MQMVAGAHRHAPSNRRSRILEVVPDERLIHDGNRLGRRAVRVAECPAHGYGDLHGVKVARINH